METGGAPIIRPEPSAARLVMPKHYETAEPGATLLSWSGVATRLVQATNSWLATTSPDGRPHVAPVWGVWVDNTLYLVADAVAE